MDQNLKKKIDLNSATSGAGLVEAIFSCFEASANPTPLTGGRIQIKIFFSNFGPWQWKFFKNLLILSIASRIFKQKLFRGRALLHTSYT